MKKILSLVLAFTLILSAAISLAACSNTTNPSGNGGNQSQTGNGNPDNDNSGNGNGQIPDTNDNTPIILTINGNIVLSAYLNSSAPAKSLVKQLPLTVRLGDSDNDFCGGNINIEYTDSDVQYGYKDGDLAFWTPANNFVIFVDDEESSSGTGNLIILGRITDDLSVFDNINGTISVTIELKEETPSVPENPEIPTEPEQPEIPETPTVPEQPDNPGVTEPEEQGEYLLRITVGDTVLIAEMYDNETTAAIRKMLPMSLPMMDLYGREMCYRFADALPASGAATSGYEVGEIVYYPPMHSFVIMYAQNGERFQMQKLGKITGDVSVFNHVGDVTVSFEIIEK